MNQQERLELLKEINEILTPYPEALAFINAYNEYVHLIDDIVDEKHDVSDILKVFSLAATIYSSNFWQQNKDALWVIEQLINNTYRDSVVWEQSSVAWKRNHAKSLSHCGYNMFYAVILIVAGKDKLDEISLRFREHSHTKHDTTIDT